jgi:hypothetical protein
MALWLLILRDEILPSAGKWMELEIIMLNKISQTQKDTITSSLSYMWKLKKINKS